MDLRNITPFSNFKRIVEEASIPNEFSNGTGFKESLVGRAMFGIFRYFKKGIDWGKLEFYKRKLENEYFAGLLRFFAVKNINLKTGEMPVEEGEGQNDVSDGGGGSENKVADPYEHEYCKVLGVDYTSSSYNNDLATIETNFNNNISILDTIINDPNASDEDRNDAQDLKQKALNVVNCCKEKRLIIPTFVDLYNLSGTTDPKIIGYLDQIKNFLNGNVAKLCSTYKGTDAEKTLLKAFVNSTDTNIKDKITNEILPLFDNFNYNKYNLINEKITSGINKYINITQMLGDQLNEPGAPQLKVNIYEYLERQGIKDVNEINFDAIEKLFRSNPNFRKESSDFVNADGVRKIQYAVSRIIFHIKKTPDNRGVNPGEGGKVQYEEDSSLKTSWEKKVQFVKSEFRNYLLVEKELDPFVLLNYTDALRSRGKYGSDPVIIGYAGSLSNLGNSSVITPQSRKMGLIPKGDDTVKDGSLYIYSFGYKGKVYYPVFYMKTRGGDAVYRYIGNINMQKIIDDKAYDDANFKNIVNDYSAAAWESPKSKSDTDFINLLKINPLPTVAGYNFDSMYMTHTDYNMIKSYRNLKKWNIRLLYTFVESVTQSNGVCAGAKAGADNFKMKFLSNNGFLKDFIDLMKIKSETAKDMLNIEFGEVFEIEPGWYDIYFKPIGGNQVSKYMNIPFINEDPYVGSRKIGLKT